MRRTVVSAALRCAGTTSSAQAKTPAFLPGSATRRRLQTACCSGRNARLLVGGLAQHITAAPDRLDIVLAVGRVGELLAQLADEHVDDLELGLVHAAIEVVEEHLL